MTSEEYYTKHQHAFRCAFNFLNEHFPPGEEPKWWEKMSDDIKAADDSQEGNKLATYLLIGVLDYLDYEYKRRNNNEKTDD